MKFYLPKETPVSVVKEKIPKKLVAAKDCYFTDAPWTSNCSFFHLMWVWWDQVRVITCFFIWCFVWWDQCDSDSVFWIWSDCDEIRWLGFVLIRCEWNEFVLKIGWDVEFDFLRLSVSKSSCYFTKPRSIAHMIRSPWRRWWSWRTKKNVSTTWTWDVDTVGLSARRSNLAWKTLSLQNLCHLLHVLVPMSERHTFRQMHLAAMEVVEKLKNRCHARWDFCYALLPA